MAFSAMCEAVRNRLPRDACQLHIGGVAVEVGACANLPTMQKCSLLQRCEISRAHSFVLGNGVVSVATCVDDPGAERLFHGLLLGIGLMALGLVFAFLHQGRRHARARLAPLPPSDLAYRLRAHNDVSRYVPSPSALQGVRVPSRIAFAPGMVPAI